MAITTKKGGSTLDIPVIYQEGEDLEGIQFALRFDPDRWELINPSIGDIPSINLNNFGLTKKAEGLIAFS